MTFGPQRTVSRCGDNVCIPSFLPSLFCLPPFGAPSFLTSFAGGFSNPIQSNPTSPSLLCLRTRTTQQHTTTSIEHLTHTASIMQILDSKNEVLIRTCVGGTYTTHRVALADNERFQLANEMDPDEKLFGLFVCLFRLLCLVFCLFRLSNFEDRILLFGLGCFV